ncbi:MAG: hypothetical protein HY430_03240 [Candidatus Levybacteria bacterium]|nr:hypothetical protein [Candidatus Levybacteria bacterium]
MRVLARLEKRREIWFLFIVSFLFFLLRLPSLIEPYWYGDEGIYQVIGMALREGRALYSGIWDNKPPLLYLTYALFAADQFTIRLVSLLFGLGAVLVFFFLATSLFRSKNIVYFITTLYAVLYGLPLIEGNIANAENFMQLFILGAGLIVFRLFEKREIDHHPFSVAALHYVYYKTFLAGVFLGIAFLFKIVAIFDIAALACFILIVHLPFTRISFQFIKEHQKILFHGMGNILSLLFGFVVPTLLTMTYFYLRGGFAEFMQATFFSNIGYVGHKNELFFPQGFLLLRAFLLSSVVAVLLSKRKLINVEALFIVLWFAFSVFNAYFSNRPYTHYVLVALPSTMLFIGLLIQLFRRHRLIVIMACIGIVLLARNFGFYSLKKTVGYYPNYLQFVLQQKSFRDYIAFFDSDTPRDYAVANILRRHPPENNTVFIWGNSASMYALSDTLPPGRYTVAYHIGSNKAAVAETAAAIEETKPGFIVIMPDIPYVPFSLTDYTYRITLRDTSIYERTH